ncbi:MAG TPA: radical SAM protein [Victivallales bacterium]|nr:radical SAM protein [Victivallales bacterium]
MCARNTRTEKKFYYKERLNTERILRILREGADNNCPSVSFQGDNEPFLIDEITDWFGIAKGMGYLDIMVNTNGTIMSDELAEKIIKSGLTRLRFSMDAIKEETYFKIRGGDLLPKIKENVLKFLEIKDKLKSDLPFVGVNFLKLRENSHELEDFIQFWRDKADFIVLQDFITPDIYGDYNAMDIETRQKSALFKCNQPWQRLYIRGNCDVCPCCAMFCSYLKLGNLNHSSLKEMWHSKKMKGLREIHKNGLYYKNKVCNKCTKSGFST